MAIGGHALLPEGFIFLRLTCGLRVKVLMNEPEEVTGGKEASFRIG